MRHKIVIDFETYYDQEYTLSKITTAEYINSPLFDVVLVALALDSQAPQWFSGTKQETQEWLNQFPWKDSLVIAHNAKFDGAILEWVFGIKPAKYFCTADGSRPWLYPYTGSASLKNITEYLGVGVKGTEVLNMKGKHRCAVTNSELLTYAAYCMNDVDLSARVAAQTLPLFPDDELELIDLTVKKFTRPQLLIDYGVCSNRLHELVSSTNTLIRQSGVTVEVLNSNKKFAEALMMYGVTPPTKTSATTGKQAFAFAKTDTAFLALLQHPVPAVQKLVKARLGVKSNMEARRLERLAAIYRSSNQRELPVPLLYYGAHTGRYSGADKINLQNAKRGSAIRKAIIASDDSWVLAGDLSQIEARILAVLAGQDDLIEQFANGEDVYSIFASKLYGKKINKYDYPKERFVGKTAILSLGYQAGATKFHGAMSITEAALSMTQATEIVRTYRDTYPKIKKLWYDMEDMVKAMTTGTKLRHGPVVADLKKLWLPNDMPLMYVDLCRGGDGYRYRVGKTWKHLYGGKLTENIVQALARIVMTTAELKLARRGLPSALTVHDELIYVVKKEYIEPTKEALQLALTSPVEWMPNLPLSCDIHYGQSYYDAK